MGKFIDLTGVRFGRLVAKERVRHPSGLTFWLCRCDCGNESVVRACGLRSGHTKSCGCFNRQVAEERRTKHGLSRTPEYKVWLNIKDRCCNENSQEFHNYGARGICICDRWIHSFENFLEDMGARPSRLHSIDRIDNDGDYTQSNCRWATPKEQNNNQRRTRFFSFAGETLPRAVWAQRMGMKYQTLQTRLRLGWSVERALTTEVRK